MAMERWAASSARPTIWLTAWPAVRLPATGVLGLVSLVSLKETLRVLRPICLPCRPASALLAPCSVCMTTQATRGDCRHDRSGLCPKVTDMTSP